MYSEKDLTYISGKIRKNYIVLGIVAAVMLAVFVCALVFALEWLAMIMGPVIFVTVAYGFTAYIVPNSKYRRFLKDTSEGLSREMRGCVVEISENEDVQDGVRVLPVRIQLADEDDERIVYLNVSKRELFANVGDNVSMNCFGRHILSWTAV